MAAERPVPCGGGFLAAIANGSVGSGTGLWPVDDSLLDARAARSSLRGNVRRHHFGSRRQPQFRIAGFIERHLSPPLSEERFGTSLFAGGALRDFCGPRTIAASCL